MNKSEQQAIITKRINGSTFAGQMLIFFCLVLFVITLAVYLLEFQLVCRYTNRIIDHTKNMKNIHVKSVTIGKTNLSALTTPLKQLAHWDVLCFSDDGKIYAIYTASERDNKRGSKYKDALFDTYVNGIEYSGNRTIFVKDIDKLRWKYKIEANKIYKVNRKDLTLYDVAFEFSNNIMTPYHALYYNCFHNCRQTIKHFVNKHIENKTFSLSSIIKDVPKAITSLKI